MAGAGGFSQGVVEFEDHPLGAVLAVLLLVLPLHHRERVHDLANIVAADAVKAEEGGVDFTAEYKTPFAVLAVRRAVVATIRIGDSRDQDCF
jgi:hypothetical protein